MNLKEFLVSERQWPRHVRISHAQAMLKNGENPSFWRKVLKALGAR